MSLFSFDNHTSFLLSKVRQWVGPTSTQKSPSCHHTRGIQNMTPREHPYRIHGNMTWVGKKVPAEHHTALLVWFIKQESLWKASTSCGWLSRGPNLVSAMIYGPVKPSAASAVLGHKLLSLHTRQGVAGSQTPPATTVYSQGFFVEANRAYDRKFLCSCSSLSLF